MSTLHTINLEVADPQKTKRFYIDVMGMTENTEGSSPEFVYLESPGAHMTIAVPKDGTAAAPTRSLEIGFKVDDLKAFGDRLAEHNVSGFHVQTMDWGETIEGQDPDGHRIVVYAFG